MTLGTSVPPAVVCRFGVTCPTASASSGFDTPDYIDSFTLHTSAARERSAERWARAVLEEAPLSRRSARRMWQLMGLRLGPPPYSAGHVQGWTIADTGANWIRLETQSWYLSAQAVCVLDDVEPAPSLSLCSRCAMTANPRGGSCGRLYRVHISVRSRSCCARRPPWWATRPFLPTPCRTPGPRSAFGATCADGPG